MSDFDLFWAAYPRRESKLAAMKEYIHARRLVSAETILDAVERYRHHVRFRELDKIKMPSTWLRDGCWMDEYDSGPVVEKEPDCDHEPRCNSKEWCRARRMRESA